MTSMDDVMMRMRANVMATPVSPAMVVNMTMVGFCIIITVKNCSLGLVIALAVVTRLSPLNGFSLGST